MNEEIMKGILSLMQNSVEGSRMSTEMAVQFMQNIGMGVQQEISFMERMVHRIENMLTNLVTVSIMARIFPVHLIFNVMKMIWND